MSIGNRKDEENIVFRRQYYGYHNVDDRGLGDGYVQMIARRLEESGEEARVENRGHDGFTVQGLWRMLGRDCILRKPDVVSILIGCNDVGIMMNTGKSLNEQGFARYYQNLLEEILTETVADIICMGPFIFPHPEEYRQVDSRDSHGRADVPTDCPLSLCMKRCLKKRTEKGTTL